MRRIVQILLVLVIASAAFYFGILIQTCSKIIPVQMQQVFFCPADNCAQALIDQINNADSSIHIAIYSFTLDSISEALVNAHARGVEVKIVFEKTQISKYSQYEKMLESGIDVRKDSNPAYMHNKFAVIDGKIVITGSYNWSERASEKNDENLLIISSEGLAEEYEKSFRKIFEMSI